MKLEIKKINGLKTYSLGIALIIVGVVLMNKPGVATWANLSGDYGKVVGEMLGWICILMGLRDMSMRHAISKLERLIRNE